MSQLRRPWSINETMGHESGDPARASVSFSEEVAGYIDFDETGYDAAFRAGQAAGRRLTLQLAITADDVDRCIAEGRATAQVTGWVRGHALGGPLEIERGAFHLAIDADGARRMDYRLRFRDGADRPVTLVAFKEARGELADAPTALYTRLLAGHVDSADEPAAPVMATGILHLHPDEFARQLSSFRVSPPLRLDALASFGVLVAGDLWDTYR
jgi:cholesterol oxidase